jgi:hypothetical protein
MEPDATQPGGRAVDRNVGVTGGALLLVIPAAPDIERDRVADAWSRSVGDALRLDRFWEPPPLDRSVVRLYGNGLQPDAQMVVSDIVSPVRDDNRVATWCPKRTVLALVLSP